MCVRPRATSCAPHTVRASGADLRHLLSRQVMFPFASASLPVCLLRVCLTHWRLTLMGSRTAERGCSALVRWHLPECRVTDISHPAVTDDGGEQGQRFFFFFCSVLSNPGGPLARLCSDLWMYAREVSACSLGTVSSIFFFFFLLLV